MSYHHIKLEEGLNLGHQKPPGPKRRVHQMPLRQVPLEGQGGGFEFVFVPLTTQDIKALKKELRPYLDDPRGGGTDRGIFGKCGLYMERLRFSVTDFVWVIREVNDFAESSGAVGG